MPPLPRAQDTQVLRLPDNARCVYVSRILPAEEAAMSAGNPKKIIHARILGYILLNFSNQAALDCIVREVNSAMEKADSDTALDQLGQMYYNYLIYPFRQSRSHTPISSSHSSRESAELRRNVNVPSLASSPSNHQQAKRNALIRDGFRCMLSGDIECTVWIPEAFDSKDSGLCSTYCCHILPGCVNKFNDVADSDCKNEWEAGVWNILARFGYKDVMKELQGQDAHRLENVLTLGSPLRILFDRLDLWLEAVPGEANTYQVRMRVIEVLQALRLPSRVTFAVHEQELPKYKHPGTAKLPLPDPRYLEIHAACCRVAYMSGATEHLNQVMRDMEDTTILAEDGGSAEVLAHAMLRLIPQVEADV